MRFSAEIAALALLLSPTGAVAQSGGGGRPSDLSRLTAEHRAELRCAATFAILASEQSSGRNEALAFPPLAVRGKRYFVDVSTRVIAEAGLTREQVRDLLVADVATMQKRAAVDPADAQLFVEARGCLARLDKAVPPLVTPDLLQCTAIMTLAFEDVHGREGMTAAAQDIKTLASVLTAREREALIAAGKSGDEADRAVGEAHDAMLKEAFDDAGGIEKYDIAHCYDLAKPDEKTHY